MGIRVAPVFTVTVLPMTPGIVAMKPRRLFSIMPMPPAVHWPTAYVCSGTVWVGVGTGVPPLLLDEPLLLLLPLLLPLLPLVEPLLLPPCPLLLHPPLEVQSPPPQLLLPPLLPPQLLLPPPPLPGGRR